MRGRDVHRAAVVSSPKGQGLAGDRSTRTTRLVITGPVVMAAALQLTDQQHQHLRQQVRVYALTRRGNSALKQHHAVWRRFAGAIQGLLGKTGYAAT